MLIPTSVTIIPILTPKSSQYATLALDITEKSKGNRLSSVATVAIPKMFRTTNMLSRSSYLSKIIDMICPIACRTSVMLSIHSH